MYILQMHIIIISIFLCRMWSVCKSVIYTNYIKALNIPKFLEIMNEKDKKTLAPCNSLRVATCAILENEH